MSLPNFLGLLSSLVPGRRESPVGLGSPRLSEYQGAWAIEESAANALIEHARRINVRLHLRAVSPIKASEYDEDADAVKPKPSARFGDDYGEQLLDDGTAVIRVDGTMMKFSSSLSRGTSTVAVRRQVRKAQNDPGVARVLMMFDSPGGTVSGTQDLADDVASLAAVKPCAAYVEDLCCSAAMWVASQCSTISAGRSALVGSIGAVMAVPDMSVMAKKAGVKVHVITSSGAEKFKGAGIPGSKVTDEQLGQWKATLDDLNSHFLAAVAKGRGMKAEEVAKIADGRVHIADKAAQIGLIDFVESADAALTRLKAAAPGGPIQRPTAPAKPARKAEDEPTTPTAETPTALPTNPTPGGVSAEQPPAEASAPSPAATPAGADEPQEVQMDPKTPPAATERKAATVAEIKAACPGASADFVLAQAEKGVTLPEAKDAFIVHQGEQLKSSQDELAKAKTATPPPAATAPKKPGVPPLESGRAEKTGEAGGSAADQFAEAVEAQVKLGRSREQAVSHVARSKPELHKAMLAEANPGRQL